MSWLRRTLNIAFLVFVLASNVNADAQLRPVFIYDGVAYPSGPDACAAFIGSLVQLTAEPPRSWSAWQDNGSAFNPGDPLEYQCRAIAYRSDGGVGSQQTRGLNLRQSNEIIEHDHAEERCEALTGNVEFLETDTGPSTLCLTSCSMTQIGIAVSLGDDPSWWSDYQYTGETCATASPVTPPAAATIPAPPNTETISQNADGSENEPHTTPDVPPPDAEPPTGSTELPAASQSPEGPAAGSTVSTYTGADGSEITVITDADGNVTYTDKDPSTSSGTYATTSGGTTDGTTGGTTDGTTGSTTGSTTGQTTDGTTGGTTDGTCEGTDCGDGDENRSASGGATCDTQPECSGDPINCAINKQAWLLRCESEVPSETQILGDLGLSDISAEQLSGDETELEQFDDSGFLSGGESCPPDYTIDVKGMSLSFSFAPMCSLATFIGMLVMVGAGIHSTKIVVGAF